MKLFAGIKFYNVRGDWPFTTTSNRTYLNQREHPIKFRLLVLIRKIFPDYAEGVVGMSIIAERYDIDSRKKHIDSRKMYLHGTSPKSKVP
jgi:hypothetical protein